MFSSGILSYYATVPFNNMIRNVNAFVGSFCNGIGTVMKQATGVRQRCTGVDATCERVEVVLCEEVDKRRRVWLAHTGKIRCFHLV